MKFVETIAIIVAGGKGLRMGSDTKKQYLKICDIPVLTKTLHVFDKCSFIHHLILVVPKEDTTYCKQQILDPYNFGKSVLITKGGNERQDSVFQGLKMAKKYVKSPNKAIVLIHDGVRPFISEQLIKNCVEKAITKGACIPGIKIVETIKKVKEGDLIQETVNREKFYTAQTPQAFKLSLLLHAYEHAQKNDFVGTDDASLVERMGTSVCIVEGLKTNIKITTPEDLVFAEYLSKINMDRFKENLKKINK